MNNKYDYTANDRMKKRTKRIRNSGLSELKVTMHKDDATDVRRHAKKLYVKRGIKLLKPD